MLSFYSTRHHPFTKQVHSPALITILAATEVISAFFGTLGRKEINTEMDFHNYTRFSVNITTTHEVSDGSSTAWRPAKARP